MSLKEAVKHHAYELGADLVGFGDVGRCRHAPPRMSPQGLWPEARTVIVMALHHPDACIERGGERHPQEIGPYSVQYLMNSRLDEMAYRLATFLERSGHGALPIVSSNIWRYNRYKDLDAVFAPDLSHIYMAVVAGLADLGFNGLALSPEYGARNRFITVLTDAAIEPDPLIPPGTVCDRCMLCRKHCPSAALSKEIAGEKVLRIGAHEYRFPDKNLWRCAWGEHFDLDLDLEIPEVVTEEVILRAAAEHGFRGGEMGQCLKFCVPAAHRAFDLAYSRTPLRVHWADGHEAVESRAVTDRLLARAGAGGADRVRVRGADELRAEGVDLEALLPGARSAVTVAVGAPEGAAGYAFRAGARYQVDSLCFDLTRALEDLGYRSLMRVGHGGRDPDADLSGRLAERMLDGLSAGAGRALLANTVVTRKTLPPGERRFDDPLTGRDRGDAAADPTAHLLELARRLGADLVGVAPAERLDAIAGQLRPVFDGVEVLDAADRAGHFRPWEPEITARRLAVRAPADHLPGARSVLVFALRLHREVVRRATLPPAEAVGPYAYQTYITHALGLAIGYRLVRRLEAMGHAAVLTADLTGTDSFTATPRGLQPDLFANRFAGLAAGLGYLAVTGHLVTPSFGMRQRCLAIVTDAPLRPSPLYRPAAGEERCRDCPRPCMTRCPSRAIGAERIELDCEGRTYAFHRVDRARCDWVKRHALQAAGGFGFLGSTVDLPFPETLTPAALADGLRRLDPIKKYRPAIAEPCVLACPYGGGQNGAGASAEARRSQTGEGQDP